MSWTSPRTWVAGETVTAALLNTHLRDNLLELNGTASAWTAYTPTLTNFAATITQARYKQEAKAVFVEATLTFTGAATGALGVSLPVAELAAYPAAGTTIFGIAVSNIGGTFRNGFASKGAAARLQFISDGAGVPWAAAVPAAWAAGSVLGISIQYEAA